VLTAAASTWGNGCIHIFVLLSWVLWLGHRRIRKSLVSQGSRAVLKVLNCADAGIERIKGVLDCEIGSQDLEKVLILAQMYTKY